MTWPYPFFTSAVVSLDLLTHIQGLHRFCFAALQKGQKLTICITSNTLIVAIHPTKYITWPQKKILYFLKVMENKQMTKICQKCVHNVLKMYSKYIQNVLKMYQKCMKKVLTMYPKCIQNTSKMYSKCIQNELKMYPNLFKMYPNLLKMYLKYACSGCSIRWQSKCIKI